MRFLADENFPGAAIIALREAAHDIASVRASSPGMSDQDVIDWAVRERRILLTFDKDFGDLARKMQLPEEPGVVLFRLTLPRPAEIGARLVSLLASRSDWAGHFSVIEPGRIRMRPLL
ncbi:MAG: DUF5615 family PIN-like protein [Alphaproteobacteria bacterium]|nr:DUF5615 family PIN-like protein [Alphaproteobacteria bacterium]